MDILGIEIEAVLASFVLLGFLGWISLSDLRSFRIPDRASLTLLILGLFWSALPGGIETAQAVIGTGIGYLSFAVLGGWYYRKTGQDGLGLGDAKLLAAAGAWLGWSALPMLVASAALAALLFAVVTRQHRLAFGPWLAGALWVMWVRQVLA